jgi:GNAT superfamily N-acetyltransferase
MSYTVTSVDRVPDAPALSALLLEYYAIVLAKLAAAGGPTGFDPATIVQSFWSGLDRVLPPTGRLVLAHDTTTGRLVGCGTLQQARPDAGELKRLYVRPEANGHGLGRALVAARMQAARDMGWTTLLVNAVRGNTDMLRLYQDIGFRFIDRYPECSDPTDLAPYFIYMRYDL